MYIKLYRTTLNLMNTATLSSNSSQMLYSSSDTKLDARISVWRTQ